MKRFLVVTLVVMLISCEGWATFLADLAKPQSGRSMRETSTHKVGPDGKFDANGEPDSSNWDNRNLEPGKTRVLMQADGPGVVTHIWMTFLGPGKHGWAKNGSANHQEMLLRIYYDGSQRPGVEAPVGEFFANCFGRRDEVISMPVVVEDADSYNCYWQMPFRKSIRMEIENQSDKPVGLLYYNIDWIKKKKLPRKTPYFYAQYNQAYPTAPNSDYTVLATEGKGHFVGCVLGVRSRHPAWFGEGDEKIYIDGEEKASIWGTGTEDYFLSAWGLKECGTPYFGVPHLSQRTRVVGQKTSSYRWHINDPIVFNKSIKVTFENYGWNANDEIEENKTRTWFRDDDYASVAFWYQTGTPTFAARAPHARERKLPNLDIIFNTHKLDDVGKHGAGSVKAEDLRVHFPNNQMYYNPGGEENAWIEIPFEVKVKEPRRLLIRMTTANNYGRYQAYLDGVKLRRPMDFYSEGLDKMDFHLLDFWPDPGKYTLRLKCVGKNDRSDGYCLGIESLRLRQRHPRVKKYGHEKDNDWRKEPLFHR
jgi:D-arabinan exo alpha-(1,3)/(1,5)-arabinofuranosidase (non-reducing end)